MRQNVVAGKTPAGTKIGANLVVATLVDGVVIPRGAAVSGEVTESVAKTKTDPSRLAIRMDSAEWKNGSAPIKLYLTAWYYPVTLLADEDVYAPSAATSRPRLYSRRAINSDPNDPATQPFPDPGGDNSGHAGPASSAPASSASPSRVLMKDVESTRQSGGAVALTSKRSNIKLDKTTTYVFATGDLLAAK